VLLYIERDPKCGTEGWVDRFVRPVIVSWVLITFANLERRKLTHKSDISAPWKDNPTPHRFRYTFALT
jgi:hypothetical protein